jgi:hypothetical protein
MSSTFKGLLIWIAGSFIAILMALNYLPACRMPDGHYVPLTNDSFYHARRILDALHGPLYQFDPHIHVPEGSWLTWPWAYDLSMAYMTRAGMALTGATDPMAVMVYLPLLIVMLNTGLVLALAGALGLNLPLRVMAVGCFVLSPLTQTLHAVGQLDHHDVELSFVLASLWLGMRWAQHPSNAGRGALLGLVLGLAPAFHTELFLLQLPLLTVLGIAWLKGRSLPAYDVLPVTGALFAGTLLALLPSGPFWDLQFSFYTLSWFHLYVACGTILIALLCASPRAMRSGATLVIVGALLALAVAPEILSGGEFILSQTYTMDRVMETRSILHDMIHLDAWPWVRHYSVLLLVLPFVLLVHTVKLIRDKGLPSLWLAVWVIFGGAMLLQQYRFHYYGSFALYIPLLLWVNDRLPVARRSRAAVLAGLGILLILAYVPVKPRLFPAMLAPSGEYDYFITQPLYQTLRAACEKRPGVVLAAGIEGHYIRYHTQCDVIANNFTVTPLHIRKVREVEHLMGLSAAALRRAAPTVRYLLLTRNGVAWRQFSSTELQRLNPGLRGELLLHGPPFPSGFRLLNQVALNNGGRSEVMARLFEIDGGR